MKNAIRSLIGAGLLALTGCDPVVSPVYRGSYEGYSVEINGGRSTSMTIYDKGKDAGHIFAYDSESDERFDSITLISVPKGSGLEAFTSSQKLEKIYNSVVQEAQEAEKENSGEK